MHAALLRRLCMIFFHHLGDASMREMQLHVILNVSYV